MGGYDILGEKGEENHKLWIFKKVRKKLKKPLDKKGSVCQNTQALDESGTKRAERKEIWKNLKKVLDKRGCMCQNTQALDESEAKITKQKEIWKNLKKVLDK